MPRIVNDAVGGGVDSPMGLRQGLFRGRAVVSAPKPVNVRALRRRLRMTQNTFSARFGFSVAALRHWERGERRPSGAALTLLNVIAHQPRAVLVALRAPIPENLREKPRQRHSLSGNPSKHLFWKSDPEEHR